MPSLTVENYLKAVLQIAIQAESDWVSTGQLAQALNVSPGTVTSMLKTLAESELATYKPYEGVQLTKAGRLLALRMLRRHRLIELFLVKTLNLTWDQVHEEAENMEHAVSDALIDHIDEFLGHPQSDPHGDPIPSANGDMRGESETSIPLTAAHPGVIVKVVRVMNQDPDFLRYLSDTGLDLGAEGAVVQNSPEAGVVTVELAGRPIALGHQAAVQILVEPAAESEPRDVSN